MDIKEKNIKKLFEDKNTIEHYKVQKNYNLFSRKRAVLDLLKDVHFGKVLDLGCGSGGYLDIKEQHECVYFGIDFSENMINAAREKSKELGIEKEAIFQQGNAESVPFDNNFFDVVLAIGLIEYFEKPDKLIEEIRRVLRREGTLIMQSFIPNPYVHALKPILEPCIDFIRFMTRKEKKVAHKQYTKEQLDDLLSKNGFQLTDFAYSNFYLLPTTPFSEFFHNIHIYFSECFAKKGSKRFGFFAVNYIGKYRLTK